MKAPETGGTKQQRVWLQRPDGTHELVRPRNGQWFTDEEYRAHLIAKARDKGYDVP